MRQKKDGKEREKKKDKPLFLPAAIWSVFPVSYCRSNVVKQQESIFIVLFFLIVKSNDFCNFAQTMYNGLE